MILIIQLFDCKYLSVYNPHRVTDTGRSLKAQPVTRLSYIHFFQTSNHVHLLHCAGRLTDFLLIAVTAFYYSRIIFNNASTAKISSNLNKIIKLIELILNNYILNILFN